MNRPRRQRGSLPAQVGARPVSRQGLSSDEISARLEFQGNRCLFCRVDLTPSEAQVDHDHRLAARHAHPVTQGCRQCFRWLLCGPCNRMLGMARDDANVLAVASVWLTRWAEAHP